MVEERAQAAAAISDLAGRVKENIGRVIVGRDEVVELALVALLADGHILIEDVPGTGKTTLAKAIAASVGCSFKRIQFTPDLMPSDVTGIHYYNQKSSEFEFRPGPIIANIVLADEINRATPRTQSALLEAMEERQVTVDGVTMPLPAPFLVLATQNPIELEGTFPLPEAQLDRFIMRVKIGYPTEQEEDDILLRFESENPLVDARAGRRRERARAPARARAAHPLRAVGAPLPHRDRPGDATARRARAGREPARDARAAPRRARRSPRCAAATTSCPTT